MMKTLPTLNDLKGTLEFFGIDYAHSVSPSGRIFEFTIDGNSPIVAELLPRAVAILKAEGRFSPVAVTENRNPVTGEITVTAIKSNPHKVFLFN